MKTKLQKRQLKVLEETVQYYSKDTARRCTDGESCSYSAKTLGTKGKGCAVGRLLPLELRNELDEYYVLGVGVAEIFDMLPKSVQSLSVKFLESLQDLHDLNLNWDDKGLTDFGIENVSRIKKKFDL